MVSFDEISQMIARVRLNCPGDDLTAAVIFLLERARDVEARRELERGFREIDRRQAE